MPVPNLEGYDYRPPQYSGRLKLATITVLDTQSTESARATSGVQVETEKSMLLTLIVLCASYVFLI
jgi:hypothetical protein